MHIESEEKPTRKVDVTSVSWGDVVFDRAFGVIGRRFYWKGIPGFSAQRRYWMKDATRHFLLSILVGFIIVTKRTHRIIKLGSQPVACFDDILHSGTLGFLEGFSFK